jgi:RHS repeat-associated protein
VTGVQLDQPLSITRIGFGNYDPTTGFNLYQWQPYTVVPHWNWRAKADNGTFGDGGRQHCQMFISEQRCVEIYWPGAPTYAFDVMAQSLTNWHGTLLDGKHDGTGTVFRRNRVVDPSTGRFTQEDPIGLAGGLNLYGYANGDPVNFSDPFGLFPWRDRLLGIWATVALAFGQAIPGRDVLEEYAEGLKTIIVARRREGLGDLVNERHGTPSGDGGPDPRSRQPQRSNPQPAAQQSGSQIPRRAPHIMKGGKFLPVVGTAFDFFQFLEEWEGMRRARETGGCHFGQVSICYFKTPITD